MNLKTAMFSIALACFYAGIYSFQPPVVYNFSLTDTEIPVSISAAEMDDLIEISTTIKEMLTDAQGVVVLPTETVTLPEISKFNFNFIRSRLQSIKNKNIQAITTALKEFNQDQLLSMLKNANFLDIPVLLEAAAKIYAEKYAFSDAGISSLANAQAYQNYVDTFPVGPEISALIAQNLQQTPVWQWIFSQYIQQQGLVGFIDIPLTLNLNIRQMYWKNTTQLVTLSFIQRKKTYTLTIWDTVSGKPIHSITTKPKTRIFINPYNLNVYFTYNGKEITMYDIISDKKLMQIAGSGLTAYMANPSNTLLATGNKDGVITIWDLKTGEKKHTFQQKNRDGEISPPLTITAIAWSPDGTKLASGNEDAVIMVCDLPSLKTISTFLRINPIKLLQWSPDNNKIVATHEHNALSIWNLTANKRFAPASESTHNIASDWHPDSNTIAIGSSRFTDEEGNAIQYKNAIILDVNSGNETKVFDDPGPTILSIGWSPDGLLLATGSNQGYVYIINTKPKKLIHRLHYDATGIVLVTALAWSSDGTKLAARIFSTQPKQSFIRIWTLSSSDFFKIINQLDLLQAQLLVYMHKNKIKNFTQLPEHLWDLFNNLPNEIKNLFIEEKEVPEEEYKEAMEIVEEFEKEEMEEPSAKRQKTEE
jgi:WD40 repeat protein